MFNLKEFISNIDIIETIGSIVNLKNENIEKSNKASSFKEKLKN